MTKLNHNTSNHKRNRSGEPEWIDLETTSLDDIEPEMDAAEESRYPKENRRPNRKK